MAFLLAFWSLMYSSSPLQKLADCSRHCENSNTVQMTTGFDSSANPAEPRKGFLSRHVFTTNHRAIGLNYLWLGLFSVFLGMAMSLLMRIHLIWPGTNIPVLSSLASAAERYATLPLLHGSLMVFFVLTAVPQAGFGNYLLPLQIGAPDVAFPALNLVSFWATVASLLGITTSFLIHPSSGITLWVLSVAVFSASTLFNSLNFAVTTIDLRAKGMTLPRLPLTVWAWFINAILSLLIFSILLAACLCLLADRFWGTHFFHSARFLASLPPNLQATTVLALWQRLFWFFAQAEVYVAMLPCFGLVTHLLATLSRRPVWRERLVVFAFCGVGLVGFFVWGQHMFSSAMDPFSPLVFSAVASSLGIPAMFLILGWLATLWGARIELSTSMLFALGFVSLFLSGGISGIFLARQDLSAAAVSDEFITGHFHLVMGVAATFAILSALFFWFPKLFGRLLNEPLGKLHFWLTFAGVYSIFMPMHWLGLVEHLRSPSTHVVALADAGSSLRSSITVAVLLTVFAQGLFLFNFLWSLFRGEEILESNPWRATTLEWNQASPVAGTGLGTSDLVVYRGAYEFIDSGDSADFLPQHLPLAHGPKPGGELKMDSP